MSQLQWRFSASVVDQFLESVLPKPAKGCERGVERLQCAMRSAVLGDGKRTRPLLLLESAATVHQAIHGQDPFDFDLEMALPAACALELIHAYSLVHDDLPSMDDATLRRGKPACHVEWGEAMAILAGDALQTLAFEVAAHIPDDDFWISAEEPLRHLRVVKLIAQASGKNGMAGGQAMDIDWTNAKDLPAISGDQLSHLQSLKTGALIKTAAQCGAILGGGSEEQIESLKLYGEHLGRAFQIWDDVLDVEGDPNVTGKVSSDAQNLKMTYPGVFGLATSKQLASDASRLAVESLQNFGTEAQTLRDLARFVVEREK